MNRRDFLIRMGLAVPAVKTVVCFGTGIWRPLGSPYHHGFEPYVGAHYDLIILDDISPNQRQIYDWINRPNPDFSRIDSEDLERLLKDVTSLSGSPGILIGSPNP